MKRHPGWFYTIVFMAALGTSLVAHKIPFDPLGFIGFKTGPAAIAEKEAAKPIDYRFYSGKWISGKTPYEESLTENGGNYEIVGPGDFRPVRLNCGFF